MAAWLPFSALLSQAFVAFTIEFDNEFERRTPHRTTRARISSERGLPWLVSMVMWLKFMRHVPEQGIAARDLARATGLDRKGITAWLTRLRWGYVTVDREGVVRAASARNKSGVRLRRRSNGAGRRDSAPPRSIGCEAV